MIRPGDRICLEGVATRLRRFLTACLSKADPKVLHDLHVVQSSIVLPEHIDLFREGHREEARFSLFWPAKSCSAARPASQERTELGAIHTYIELFARYFVDLAPQEFALTVARSATARTISPAGSEHGGFPRGRRSDCFLIRHCRRAGQ